MAGLSVVSQRTHNYNGLADRSVEGVGYVCVCITVNHMYKWINGL